MPNFYLGDPEFTKKMTKLYAWIMPAIYGSMTILFLLNGNLLTALILLLGFIITLPLLKKYIDKIYIKGIVKVILCVLIFIAAIYSVGVYL